MSALLALAASTVLGLAIPFAPTALWLAATRPAHRPDLDPPRRTSRLTDTTPRRLL